MPVSDQETKAILNGTGSQLTFSFSFKVFKDTDISVRVVSADGVETTKTLGIDYTVTPSDDYELGGIVTFNTAPSANEKVLIIRSIPIIQDANFRPVSGFPEEVITDTFDQSRMIDQDLQEQLNRCVKVRPSSNISPEILGQEVERIYESIDNIDIVAGNQARLNTVASNILDVNTVSDNMGSVNGVADKLAEITGVSQNLAEINILSDNIDDIGTVAMGIDNVNAVGSNIGDVMSVAANEGNINTVSDNLEAIRHCSDNINDIVNLDDNAELSMLWAKGPELDLQNKTADPTAHSSKYYSEQSASAQIQADCAEMDNTSKVYINNKDLQYFANDVTRYANQDLSDLSELGQSKFDAKVNKSGDTMTGQLTIENPWGGFLSSIRPNISMGDTPSGTVNLGGFRCYAGDATGNPVAIVQSRMETSNGQSCNGVQIVTRRPDDTGWGAQMLLESLADGQALFGFPKCTAKATTTSSAAHNKVAVIVQNYVNGASWYRVWSDGWIEQGGDARIGTGDTTITFLKSFSNASYTFTCTAVSPDGASAHVTIKSLTANNIVVYLNYSNFAKNSRWYACGY